jgi:hypothetical protein
MQIIKTAPILALVSLGLLVVLPFAGAHPITPNLNWSSSGSAITTGGTNTASFGVAQYLVGTSNPDLDCPPGAFFSGTLTVTTPGGQTSTYSVTNVPCGTQNLFAVYPTAFTAGTGAPSTNTNGTYTGTWAGTTSALVAGTHPIFSVTNFFVANGQSSPSSVPEFAAPAILVAAIGLVVVAAMKRGNVLHV